MELIYIWVKEYKNIVDQEFNFSPNYNFRLKRNNKGLPEKNYTLIDLFTKNKQPNNFFGQNISNVTAIIGKNGSGKSSLLSYIMNPKTSGILVFLENNNFFVLSETDVSIKSKEGKIVTLKSNVLKNNLSLIYFDNIFDIKNKEINKTIYGTSIKNNQESIKNISLNNLFFNESLGSQSVFINHQIMKSLNILSYLKKMKNRGKIQIRIPETLYIKNISLDLPSFKMALKHNENYVKDLIREISFIPRFPVYILENLENVKEFNKLEKIIKEGEEELIYLIHESEKISEPIILKEEEISILKIQANMETDKEMLEFIKNEIDSYLEEIAYLKISYEEELEELENYKTEMLSIKKAKKYLMCNPMEELKLFLEKKSKNRAENLINMISLKYLEIFLKKNNDDSSLYNFFKNLGDWDLFPHYFNKNINNGLEKEVIKSIQIKNNDKHDISNLKKFYINNINLITNFINKHKANVYDNGLKITLNNDNINEIKNILEEIGDTQYLFQNNELILDFNWGELSSGEVSLFNILGRFYDFNQEIFKNKNKKNILIILDEPEFSFHPEWQRRFLDIFYNYVEDLTKDLNKKIQIILTSHSPFIASDLPKNNIIMLDSNIIEGNENITNKNFCEVINENKKNTFGANIFDLYKEAFFIESTFGEFSKNKIIKVIALLTPIEGQYNITEIEKKRDEIRYIINSIGEKIIKNRLEKAWKEYTFSIKEDNCQKIKRLMEEYNLKTDDLRKYIESNGELYD